MISNISSAADSAAETAPASVPYATFPAVSERRGSMLRAGGLAAYWSKSFFFRLCIQTFPVAAAIRHGLQT